MYFGLLVSQQPHSQEFQVDHDAVLSLDAAAPHRFAAFWRAIRKLMS
jgi:hypothetical protein